MLLLLSPAKTLDLSPVETAATQPRLLPAGEELIDVLRTKSIADLRGLMKVSEKIAVLNAERFQEFTTPFTTANAKPAVLAFKGDVYVGLEADTFSEQELDFAQKHLRMLSGLYGLLRARDLMQPYRLEMGTRLHHDGHQNLYDFWGDRITELINQDLAAEGSGVVLNLASKEYFKAVRPELLNGRVVNVHFREKRGDAYKIITFNAKRARGSMARIIIKEGLTRPEQLRDFAVDGYVYREERSREGEMEFIKE